MPTPIPPVQVEKVVEVEVEKVVEVEKLVEVEVEREVEVVREVELEKVRLIKFSWSDGTAPLSRPTLDSPMRALRVPVLRRRSNL